MAIGVANGERDSLNKLTHRASPDAPAAQNRPSLGFVPLIRPLPDSTDKQPHKPPVATYARDSIGHVRWEVLSRRHTVASAP